MTQIQTVPAKVQFKQFTDVFLQPAENNARLKALLSSVPLHLPLPLLSLFTGTRRYGSFIIHAPAKIFFF